MKKLLTLLGLVLQAQLSLDAQAPLPSLFRDSCHLSTWDINTGAVQFSTRCFFQYNAANLIETAYYFNSFSGVTNYYRYHYSYNANRLLTGYINEQAPAFQGPWSNFLRENYTYDAQDRITYLIGQLGTPTGWENYFQEFSWYDDLTPADSSLYQLWDAGNTTWGHYRRKFRYYQDTLLTDQIEQEWSAANTAWNDLENYAYTYYPDGKVHTQQRTLYFSNGGSQLRRDSFLYLPDGKQDSTYAVTRLLPSGSIFYLAIKYRYDAAGQLIQTESFVRNNPTAPWRPSSRTTYAYGDGSFSNDPVYELTEDYNIAAMQYEPLTQIDRSYTPAPNQQVLFREELKQRNGAGQMATQSLDSTWYRLNIVSVQTPPAAPALDCLTANPYTPGMPIFCQAPVEHQPVLLQLIDASGRMCWQDRVMPGEPYTLPAGLPTGLYVLNGWQAGQYLGAKRLVLR